MKKGDWVVATKPLKNLIDPGEAGEVLTDLGKGLFVIDWDLHGELVCKEDEFTEMESFENRGANP